MRLEECEIDKRGGLRKWMKMGERGSRIVEIVARGVMMRLY
jgi:hypothetical protein